MRLKRPTSSREAGFSLIEALVAMGLLSMAGLFFAMMMNGQNKAIQGNRMLNERDALVARLARISGDALSLQTSALSPLSQAPASTFHDCTLGGPTATSCQVTPTGLDFTLLDSAGNKVAGPSTNPQYYDLNGAPCVPSSPTDGLCAIQATSQFTASCAGAPTCTMASAINVVYTVQQRPGVMLAAGPPLKARSNSILSEIPLALTPSGTPGKIAKWISSSQLGDSVMTESAGKIGLNVPLPPTALTVDGGDNNNQLQFGSLASGIVGGIWTGDAGARPRMGLSAFKPGMQLTLVVNNGGSQPVEAVAINPNGNVGIGTITPNFLLDVEGTFFAKSTGALSDARHKKKIEPLGDKVLERVLRLHPVSFEWKEPKDHGMEGTQMGFIAQEVQTLFPTVVLTEPDREKTLGLKFNEITALLARAFQDFHRQWFEGQKQTQSRIEALERENSELRGRLERLENALLRPEKPLVRTTR